MTDSDDLENNVASAILDRVEVSLRGQFRSVVIIAVRDDPTPSQPDQTTRYTRSFGSYYEQMGALRDTLLRREAIARNEALKDQDE